MNNALLNQDIDKIARIIRDSFFGAKSSNKNWEECKEFWLKDMDSVLESLKQNGYDIVRISNKKL